MTGRADPSIRRPYGPGQGLRVQGSWAGITLWGEYWSRYIETFSGSA